MSLCTISVSHLPFALILHELSFLDFSTGSSSSSPLESIFLNRFSASFLFFADHLSAIFCLQCACKK
ncbi:unnamed protein product [Arabidopsis halleri]